MTIMIDEWFLVGVIAGVPIAYLLVFAALPLAWRVISWARNKWYWFRHLR